VKRDIMQHIRNKTIREIVFTRRSSGTFGEQEPMHPDDLKALRAWVTAKQFREVVLQKTAREIPVLSSARFPGE
jgi:hypothetical protein